MWVYWLALGAVSVMFFFLYKKIFSINIAVRCSVATFIIGLIYPLLQAKLSAWQITLSLGVLLTFLGVTISQRYPEWLPDDLMASKQEGAENDPKLALNTLDPITEHPDILNLNQPEKQLVYPSEILPADLLLDQPEEVVQQPEEYLREEIFFEDQVIAEVAIAIEEDTLEIPGASTPDLQETLATESQILVKMPLPTDEPAIATEEFTLEISEKENNYCIQTDDLDETEALEISDDNVHDYASSAIIPLEIITEDVEDSPTHDFPETLAMESQIFVEMPLSTDAPAIAKESTLDISQKENNYYTKDDGLDETEETEKQQPLSLLSQGLRHVRQKEYVQSVRCLNQVIAAEPEPELLYLAVSELSSIYQFLGLYPMASDIIKAFAEHTALRYHPGMANLKQKMNFIDCLILLLNRDHYGQIPYDQVPEAVRREAFDNSLNIKHLIS